VKALRRIGNREPADERILGSGRFVEQVIKEADTNLRDQLSIRKHGQKIGQTIQEICSKEGVNSNELQSGSRRQPIAAARLQIAQKLVEELGVSLAETARQLGVSTSAISKSLTRTKKKSQIGQ